MEESTRAGALTIDARWARSPQSQAAHGRHHPVRVRARDLRCVWIGVMLEASTAKTPREVGLSALIRRRPVPLRRRRPLPAEA
jgi:hypothetical protein